MIKVKSVTLSEPRELLDYIRIYSGRLGKVNLGETEDLKM